MRRINEDGLAKIKQWEGLVLYAYDDVDPARPPKKSMPGDHVGGTLTIGYGSTKDVKQGQALTKAKADVRLVQELYEYEEAVSNSVKVPLTDNQFSALVAFAFNVGIGAFTGSTLLKKLNAGDYNAVPKELMRWTKSTINGKKTTLPGLVNRRSAEVGLWVQGAPVASNTIPAEPAKAPIVTKESVAMVSSAVAAMGGNVFSGDGPIQYALAAMAGIIFLLGMIWFFKRRA